MASTLKAFCALLLVSAAAGPATLSAPAHATTGGVCFNMTGVPPGDVLHLRARPTAFAPSIASYKPEDDPIIAKVGSCQRWCAVSVSTETGTVRGYMNRRYLSPRECP